jgi:membrane protease YdiL (CAAX protease family)
MNDNPFTENLKQSTGIRIFIFLVILLISSLIGIAASALFVFSGDTGMKIGQGISSIFMFVVPPIVYYFITRKEHQMRDLGLRRLNPPRGLILIGVALMFVSIPFSTRLTTWNESMNLGDAFAALENYLKMLEDTAQAAIDKMVNVDTIGGLLFNLLIIALIPAVGEELTFRGVLQQSLTRKMNPHIAIFLSAAIFSFIHFQFYGFLPRMFLGLLMGYMFYITNSLWTSILMHFVNNGSAVVLYYLANKGVIEDAEHFGETDNVFIILASVLITALLVFLSWKASRQSLGKQQQGTEEGE